MQVSVYLSSATNNYLVPVVFRRTYGTFFTSDIIAASRLSLRTLSQFEASSNTSVSVFQKFFRGVTFCWTLCKVGKSLMRLFFQKIPRQQITFRHPWCERTKVQLLRVTDGLTGDGENSRVVQSLPVTSRLRLMLLSLTLIALSD